MPEVDQQFGGTPPGDFEEDKEAADFTNRRVCG